MIKNILKLKYKSFINNYKPMILSLAFKYNCDNV